MVRFHAQSPGKSPILAGRYHRSPAAFANTAQYGPLLYAPQAYILGLSKYTGGPIIIGYQAARAVAAVLAIGISTLALGLARRGAVALLVIFLTPAVISLSFTIGHEGLIFALSGLFAALLSRLETDPDARWLNISAIICIALLAMARPPYAVLSLLLLSTSRPVIRTSATNWALIGIGTAFMVPILWLWISGSIGGIPNLKAGIQPGAQVQFVLGHLTAMPDLLGGTLDKDGTVLAQHLVGVLGWLSIMLPDWCYDYGWVAMILAAFACALDESGTAACHRRLAAVDPGRLLFGRGAGALCDLDAGRRAADRGIARPLFNSASSPHEPGDPLIAASFLDPQAAVDRRRHAGNRDHASRLGTDHPLCTTYIRVRSPDDFETITSTCCCCRVTRAAAPRRGFAPISFSPTSAGAASR